MSSGSVDFLRSPMHFYASWHIAFIPYNSAIVCSSNKRHIAALLLAYSLAGGNYGFISVAVLHLVLRIFC